MYQEVKMKKFRTILATAFALSIFSITAFAGSWQSDVNGWWWLNDDGSYPVNTWMWLDGNNDGVAEYYYFNENGYMLANTTAPDGKTVDADGKWIVDGVIQTMAVNMTPTVQQQAQIPAPATVTLGMENALKQAKNYLDILSFSRSGLIGQLEFEGYTTEEATYAVDNCGADWNQQAAKKAQSYLEIMSFSRQGLISQLEFEGFTHEQAIYGVTAVGY